MEPKWLTYLRETSPDLYAEYLKESKWNIEWRDKYIKKIEDTLFLAANEDVEECYSMVQEWVNCHQMINKH